MYRAIVFVETPILFVYRDFPAYSLAHAYHVICLIVIMIYDSVRPT